nr:hypothetical protein [Tanacetum cinerariifolium]
MSIQDMEDLKQQYLDEMKSLINSEYRDEINIDELNGKFNRISIEINKKEKLEQLEQVANLSTYPSQRFNSFCYDDDDDDEDYIVAITPDFPITNSLIMENEHLDTISETESDELIKSSVENLVLIPITPSEPIDSLSVGDEHLDTILATESDEFIKSCVENLVLNPRIDKTDCHPENEIRLSYRLLYDNSSPRPPKEFNSENSNAEIESLNPFCLFCCD